MSFEPANKFVVIRRKTVGKREKFSCFHGISYNTIIIEIGENDTHRETEKKIIRIHQECLCRIRKSHRRGVESQPLDSAGAVQLCYMDWLKMDFSLTLSRQDKASRKKNLNVLVGDWKRKILSSLMC